MTDARSSMDSSELDALLQPRSIAVIGASEKPGKLGGAPIHMMQAYGYSGRIYAINSRAVDIPGIETFPSVADIDNAVDLAIIAIPAAQVTGVLEECGQHGIRAAVVFSSGFAETGDTGVQMQRQIGDIARHYGMRVVGPNSLGVVNLRHSVLATFCPYFMPPMSRDGRIGLVSQSGAFGGFVANLAGERGISFSSWITTGNEADVELAEGIAYQARDSATRVILVYMEGARNGERLMTALRLARDAGKPVIVLKVGRSAVGAEAAASHTASLAGSDEVYDAVFRQCGVHRAQSVEEWFNLGYAYAVGHPPASAELGIITVSGGGGVMMADEAERSGLTVPPLSEQAQSDIRAIVPFAGARNPVDMTGQMLSDLSSFGRMLDIVLADREVGSLISFNAGAAHTRDKGFAIQREWARVRDQYPHAHIAVTGSLHPDVRHALEEIQCLTFIEPDTAVRVAGTMLRIECQLRRSARLPPPPAAAPQAIAPGPMNEKDSLEILASAGIPVVPTALAHTPEEAAEQAEQLGYPAVLKIVSADVLHKSDVGGVALGLQDRAAVLDAFNTCTRRVSQAMPHARIDGCLVAPMRADEGLETILGVHVDPVFGPVVMFGLGGVFVEVLKDVTFRVAPFGLDEAHAMIDEIRGRSILSGVRGLPPADIDRLASTLSALSVFAKANEASLASIDINPFMIYPEGKGALALDALVVGR
ncbi:MAG: acetate--CoA ligase family protein [Ectothiorhodospiraceae bacterium]|nr:acetate--CoA ligase family protein [Ectothiorhodospiraceae bacterium]